MKPACKLTFGSIFLILFVFCIIFKIIYLLFYPRTDLLHSLQRQRDGITFNINIFTTNGLLIGVSSLKLDNGSNQIDKHAYMFAKTIRINTSSL